MTRDSQAIDGAARPTRSGAVGKRRLAREMAIQMLYQRDLAESALAAIFSSFDVPDFLSEREEGGAARSDAHSRLAEAKDAFEYARRLVEGTVSHLTEVDDLLSQQADHWRIERMPAVDRNILRLAVFELVHEPDVPKLVVLDEAVELAKRFGSDQSARFVNGLLDGLLKTHTFPGSLK
ncbi:MAG: transcription antitermination factor NusB [Acidobacteria bacterium]|nr:transcription antitermination factor NusB [Acidobacteriota bacterium]MCB9377975.1 transcription antitermination factor NusB [Holophagales bacterium]